MKFLLITGIPGTGKTTVGDNLAIKLGFTHLDIEKALQRADAATVISSTVSKCINLDIDLVITWGFMPIVDDQNIASLKNAGAKHIWFDGNRDTARRFFNKRGTVAESLFDLQIDRINQVDLVSAYNPTFYDPFDNKGNFKSLDQTMQQLLQF